MYVPLLVSLVIVVDDVDDVDVDVAVALFVGVFLRFVKPSYTSSSGMRVAPVNVNSITRYCISYIIQNIVSSGHMI